jgi:hypothetical protein
LILDERLHRGHLADAGRQAADSSDPLARGGAQVPAALAIQQREQREPEQRDECQARLQRHHHDTVHGDREAPDRERDERVGDRLLDGCRVVNDALVDVGRRRPREVGGRQATEHVEELPTEIEDERLADPVQHDDQA